MQHKTITIGELRKSWHALYMAHKLEAAFWSRFDADTGLLIDNGHDPRNHVGRYAMTVYDFLFGGKHPVTRIGQSNAC